MLPNFIIGGVQKSGTTFLTSLLINHPEIKIIKRDMDHAYFDDDRIYPKGKDWYANLFNEVREFENDHIIGQTSADCAFNPESVDRILKHNPDAKLIFVLRHPVDRAYSLYWHQYGMGREFRTFENAIKKEPKLIKKSYHHLKNYSYVERSRYKLQFEEILKKVPPENLLLLDFVSLTKNTKKSVNAIFSFLNVFLIKDLEELNYSKLPRNKTKIPSSRFVVQVSAALQNIGLVGVGRRLSNFFREDKKPPKMNAQFRFFLEKELAEDIAFYNEITQEFNKQIN
jgi:hypothetical protein